MEENILIDINESGILSLSEKDSKITLCIIKKCTEYGLGVNPGGYSYGDSKLSIENADFISNGTHILIGRECDVSTSHSNFLNDQTMLIEVLNYSKNDTLSFKNNFWSYTDAALIEDRILHHPDYPALPNYGVPYIDYSGFSYNYLPW